MEEYDSHQQKTTLKKIFLNKSSGYFEESCCSTNTNDIHSPTMFSSQLHKNSSSNESNTYNQVKHLHNDDNSHAEAEITSGKNNNIPNGLVYKLKDRKLYHYYHTINVNKSNPDSDNRSQKISQAKVVNHNTSNPSIPFKPHYLRENFDHSITITPPIPPRVRNKEAVFQRKQLTEEYFENIRRNVDVSAERASENINDSFLQPIPTSAHISNSSASLGSDMARTDGASTSIVDDVHSIEQKNGVLDLAQSLKSLKACGWYWGDMTWKDAELMLDQRPGEIGLFLLRDSQDPLHILTVTVRTDTHMIRHIRLEYTSGKFQLYDPNRGTSRGAANCVRHSNIISFINLAMKHSKNGNFLYFVRPKSMGEAPIQIQLLHPISRFACVKSLKHSTRFIIRNLAPYDDVDHLPIPLELKHYLRQSYYFDPSEDLECALRA